MSVPRTADRASLRICALIPAFDEADAIGAVVAAAATRVDRVIVIDDGSNDATGDRAREAGASVVRMNRRGGKGRALREGLGHASEREFTHVLFMDADGQHRPEDIPSLAAVADESGADLVIGCRTFDRHAMPRSRYFSNTIGSRVASSLVGHRVRDSQCGFRLARLSALQTLRLRSTGYEFEMEVLIKMSRAGFRIAHAPIATVYDGRNPRSKMNPIRDTIRICLWSLWFRLAGR